MATQEERRATTRRRILDSARECFVAAGWDATTMADIQARADVSRGALYHHFDTKQALAEAVFEETSRTAIDRAGDAPEGSGPFELLRAACLRWLEVTAEPAVASIMFDLGPTALGWARCREIEERQSLRLMTLSVAGCMDAGEIDRTTPEVLARLINAVLAEAALALADPRSRHSAEEVRATTAGLLDALRR